MMPISVFNSARIIACGQKVDIPVMSFQDIARNVVWAGTGVGLAALVGTLRLVKGWGLKTVLYPSMVPPLFLIDHLRLHLRVR